MLADRVVHDRLRGGGLVGLVVPEPAIADEVDHDIFVEAHAVAHREAGHEHHGLGIVGVHMEDRRLEHLGDIGAVHRRTRVIRTRGREAHLVVDHEVQCAAGAVPAGLRELQRFHDHALTGEGRVAVDEDRHHAFAEGVLAALLPGAHRTLHHRVHHLKMRGVEGERHMHIAALRAQVGGETLVIFDVAGTGEVRGVVLALELREQHGGRLAEHIDEHIEAAAVRHADDELLGSERTTGLDHIVEQRDQCIAAFERKTLLADVLRVQVTLETFGSGELPENVTALFRRESMVEPPRLELILQPQPLVGVRDMRELGAHRAAVGVLQHRDDVAQRAALPDVCDPAAGEEAAIEIRFIETEVGEFEDPRPLASRQTEGIEFCDQVATVGVNLDEARHRTLASTLLIDARGGDHGTGVPGGSGAQGDRRLDGAVGRFRPCRLGQRGEIAAPVGFYARRVGEVLFVQGFDIVGVTAVKSRSGDLIAARVTHEKNDSDTVLKAA